MKRLILFISLLMLAGTAYGQKAQGTRSQVPQFGTLKPRLIVEGNDTIFAFSTKQVKELAKLITNGEFDKQEVGLKDKQVAGLEKKVEIQRSIILTREKEIDLLQQKIAQRDTVMVQMERLIDLQHKEIKHLEGQLKKQSLKARLTVGIGVVLTLLFILLIIL